MFHLVHIDLFPNIFDYLSQKELLDILLINKLLYQQVMKYINNTIFTVFIIYISVDGNFNKPVNRYEISLIKYIIYELNKINNKYNDIMYYSFTSDIIFNKFFFNILQKKIDTNNFENMMNEITYYSCIHNAILYPILYGATKCKCGKTLVEHIKHYSINFLNKLPLKFADISIKEYIKTKQKKLLHKPSHPGKRTFRKK